MTSYNSFQFFLNSTSCEIESYLHEVQLLYPKICETCGTLTHLSANNKFWVCCLKNDNTLCRTKVSIFKNTIFESKKLSLKQIFYIMNEWRKDVLAEITALDLNIDTRSVQRWNNKFTKIFLWKIKNEMPHYIGGPDKIVEFDETLVVKRKFNRGRILQGQKWIVVGAERGNRENYFVEFVRHRNRATLLPVIMEHVLPGTTIMTDDWGAYRRLVRYTSLMNYSHFTVVHSRNFIDPITGAHTQTVEAVNSVLKRVLRKAGTNLGDINARIDLILEGRHKIFKRRTLFNYLFEAILEYSAYL